MNNGIKFNIMFMANKMANKSDVISFVASMPQYGQSTYVVISFKTRTNLIKCTLTQQNMRKLKKLHAKFMNRMQT